MGYTWDLSKGSINWIKKPRLIIWVNVFVLLATLNALNLRSYLKQGDIGSLSLGCLVVFPSFLAACNMYFNYCNADTCVKFLNSLLDIEGSFPSTYQDDRSIHVARMLCKSFYLSTKIAPWLLAFGAGFTPCAPSNFVAPLNFMCGIIGTKSGLRNDSGWGWWELLKSFEFVTNFYLNKVLWGILSRSCLVGLTHILVGFICQRTILIRLRRKLATGIHFKLVLYRQIQLINKLFNEFHTNVLFVWMLVTCLAETFTAHASIKLISQKITKSTLLVALWTVITTVDSMFITLVVFGLAGSIHFLSWRTLEEVRIRRSGLSEGKSQAKMRKMLRSCPPIKITFGLSNFFEKTTPLNLFAYSIERLVDLLLLTQR
ncbi:unnamed protein product [Orchesella dallaii]|uniref:Odorant receptor n=1 Tax=Orchesella dallaii TaxID=48710 RepID=A0ABP1PLB5_9HEXA